MVFLKKFGEILELLFLLVHVAGPAPLGDSTGIFGRPPRTQGCIFQYDYFKNGERISTPNPCYNCTCLDNRVMCDHQDCPIVKPLGEHCIAVKNEHECCPTFHCPKGCFVNGTRYPDGAMMPSDSDNPCEICHCIRNRASCVVEECELKEEGCSPIYKPGQCCPSRYNCSAGTNSTSHQFTLSAAVPDIDQSTTQTTLTDSVEIKPDLQISSSAVPSIMQSDVLPHEYPTVATASSEATNIPMESEITTSTVAASFYEFSTHAITEKESLPQVTVKIPEILVSHSESTPQKLNTTVLSPFRPTNDSESIMLYPNNLTLPNSDLYEKITVPTLLSDVEGGQMAHTSNTSVSTLSFNTRNATDSFTSGSQEENENIVVGQTGNSYTSEDHSLETTGTTSYEKLQENSSLTKNRPSEFVGDSHLIYFTEGNMSDSSTTSTSTESTTSKNENHTLPVTDSTKLITQSSIPATQNPLDLTMKNMTADYLPSITENVEATAIAHFAEKNQGTDEKLATTNPENITVFVTNTSPIINNSTDKVGSHDVFYVPEDTNKHNKNVSKYFTSVNDWTILDDTTLNTEDEEVFKNSSDITFSTDEMHTSPSSFLTEFSGIPKTKLTNISDSQISQEGSEANETGESAYSTLTWLLEDLTSPSAITLNETNQDNKIFPPSKIIIQSPIPATQKPLNLTIKYITADYMPSVKGDVEATTIISFEEKDPVANEKLTSTNPEIITLFDANSSAVVHDSSDKMGIYDVFDIPEDIKKYNNNVSKHFTSTNGLDNSTSNTEGKEVFKNDSNVIFSTDEMHTTPSSLLTEFPDIPTTQHTNITHSEISEEGTETNETGKNAFLSLTSLFGHLTSPLSSTLNDNKHINKTYFPSNDDTTVYSANDVYDSTTSGNPHFEEMHNVTSTDRPEEDNLTTSTELLSDFYPIQEEKLNDTDSVSRDPDSTSLSDVPSSLSQVSHEDTFNLTSSLASTLNGSNQENQTYFPSSADTDIFTESSYDVYDSPTSGNPHFEETHNKTSTDTPEEGNLTTSTELLSDFYSVQEEKLNDTDSSSHKPDSTLIPDVSSSVSQEGHEGNFTEQFEVSDTFTTKDIMYNITTMSKYVPNAATVITTTFNQTQEKSSIKPDLTSFNTDTDFVEQTSYPSIEEIDFTETSINLNDQIPNVDKNFTETHEIPSMPNSTITRHHGFDVDESNTKDCEIDNRTSAIYKNKQMLNETKNITKEFDMKGIPSTMHPLLNGTENITKDFEVANIASESIPKDELLNKTENISKDIEIDTLSTAVIPKFQNLKEIENNTKGFKTDPVPSNVTPKLDKLNVKENVAVDFIEEISLTPDAIIKDGTQTESEFTSSNLSGEFPLQDEIVKALSTTFPSNPGTMVYESHPYFFTDNRNYGKQSSEGSGICYLEDKIYRSSEQIPSDNDCEFCFCFNGDRTCLEQTCLPPIESCYSIPIKGFCCPRFHCPVQQIWFELSSLNSTSSSHPLDKNTHTVTQNPTPGCQIEGISYKLHEIVVSSSGPCIQCRCEYFGIMICQPRSCKADAPKIEDIAEVFFSRR